MRITKVLLLIGVFVAVCLPLQAAEQSQGTTAVDSTVRYFNRDILTFRSALYGVSAPDRARRAETRIKEQLQAPGALKVTQKAEAQGILLQIDGATTFWITPDDANQLAGQTHSDLANQASAALQRAIADSRESRNTQAVTRALAGLALATAAALLLAWLLKRARGALAGYLVRGMQKHESRLQVSGIRLLHPRRGAVMVQTSLNWVLGLLLFLLAYEWLSFVLASFPYTRAWSELLNGYLWRLVSSLGTAVAGAVPGLFTAVVIFYLTWAFTRVMTGFFARVRDGKTTVSWLDRELAEPTRRIVNTVIWLFALAMAYPYLPGAQTEAFKGLSVLVGLMLSLGASNLVGQAASGLILIYGRAFSVGEYVRIGEHEGTVTQLGIFATRIRTGMGEEVTLANAKVLEATSKNYSRATLGAGFVLDTEITIGYDTPWRQVHAMLEQAARRTEGVLTDPAPQVFQTALSDWYPKYRLVCQAVPSQPRPRALILSALLENIQDVFNEYGVQIMSPQYFEDPAVPKIVPPDQWYAAPAMRPHSARD